MQSGPAIISGGWIRSTTTLMLLYRKIAFMACPIVPIDLQQEP